MATQSTVQRSFAGGELAPALHARADQVKYVTGLRRCRNFLVQRHGGVANRAGLRFVAPCKTDDQTVMLMRYVSEIAGESLLIEVGDGYFRFYINGALLEVDSGSLDPWGGAVDYVIGDLVTDGGSVFYALVDNTGVGTGDPATWFELDGEVFELPSPFGSDLPHWGQSGRVITLTHKDQPPYELINQGSPVSWVLRPVTTASTIAAPVGLAFTPGSAGARSMGYVVTAGKVDTYEESGPSGQVFNAACGDPTPQAPNALSWTAQPDAAEFYVYCDGDGNGTYGFIGTATGGAATFNDPGIPPDYTITPPTPTAKFDSTDNYPNVSANFQQRRWFAYTNHDPDAIFGSRTGFISNYDISSPLQNDDAVTFKIAGNNHNPVRHLLSLKTLLAMTDAGEWEINGGGPGLPIIPSGIGADQQTYVGTNDVPPVIIGNSIVYVQARGQIVRDLQFDQQVEGLGGRDLSIFADHLFAKSTITGMDYAQTPHSIVWAIRADGILLGLTYIREQDVWGWHRHDTGAAGRFEHVCVVPEFEDDAVYVIVRRTIGGVFKRYIERLERRVIVDFDLDAFFVDSGLTYSGPPANNVAGLDHLEGEIVAVVGDGAVIFNGDPAAPNAADFTVTGGTLPVDLPAEYETIHAGLPIRFAEIETLDLDVQGDAIRDKRKRVASLTVLLEDSAPTFLAGPSSANLLMVQLEPWQAAGDGFTGNVELNITSHFDDNGRVFIRHTDPLPLTILGILPNTQMGG